MKSNKHRLRLWISIALFGAFIETANAITIGTADIWNGHSSFGKSVGEAGPDLPAVVATWGQTFTVPDDSPVLTSFSFWLRDDPLVFGGYLMQWDGHRATGPVLYDSGPVTLVEDTDWHQITFDPLKLLLTPGQQYVFFMSASKYFNGIESAGDVAGINFDGYAGGSLVHLDNGTDTSKWATEDWYVDPSSWDNTFSADFAAVPESSNASLLAISLAFLTLAGIQRKHATRTPRCHLDAKSKPVAS
jgi:hypothetical protein